MKSSICKVNSCVNKVRGLGMCNRHYLQFSRHGKILRNTIYENRSALIDGDIAKLPLGINAKDGYALIDKNHAYLDKYKWSKNSAGYPQANLGNGNLKLLHHIIIEDANGLDRDHINRNKLDNRSCNLRLITHKQNMWNFEHKKLAKSGYRGVSLLPGGTYSARIRIAGIAKHLGCFKTAREASEAYNRAYTARELA